MTTPQGDPRPRVPAFVLLLILCCLPAAAAGAVEPRPAADPTGFAELRALAEEIRTTASIPGLAFGLIDGGEVVLAEGLGFADAEGEAPVTADTAFAIGSTTKAFTATLVGILVDEGLLEWDVPVHRYLPGFTLKDPFASDRVTVRDLLGHRSGLPRHNLVFSVTPITRRELVARLCCLDASAGLRERFQYTNLGYAAAGYLVGQRTGSTWEEALRKRLLAPLGLDHTYTSEEEARRRGPVARGHWLEGGQLVPAVPEPAPSIAPAGGLYSTLDDMLRWVRFHLDGGRLGPRQLISEESLHQIDSPQIVVRDAPIATLMTHPVAPYLSYGLGWYIQVYRGRVTLFHGGRADGFSAVVSMMPDGGRGIVLLANRQGVTGQLSSLAREIEDRLLGADDVDWEAERIARLRQIVASRRHDPAPDGGSGPHAHPLAAYAGTYENAGYGTLTIAVEGDDLLFEYYRLRGLVSHAGGEVFRSSGGDLAVVLTFLGSGPGTGPGTGEGPPSAVAVPFEPAVAPIVFTRVTDGSTPARPISRRSPGGGSPASGRSTHETP